MLAHTHGDPDGLALAPWASHDAAGVAGGAPRANHLQPNRPHDGEGGEVARGGVVAQRQVPTLRRQAHAVHDEALEEVDSCLKLLA